MRPGQLPNYEKCYVCGHGNPLGLDVRFRVDGEEVVTDFIPGIHHSGYPGRTHGGILAALLDETMGWAPCVTAGRFCLSVELTIRYLKSVPPGTALRVAGRADRTEGRIWEASGEIRGEDGTVFARGRGRYFPLSEAETENVVALLTLEGERLTLREALERACGRAAPAHGAGGESP